MSASAKMRPETAARLIADLRRMKREPGLVPDLSYLSPDELLEVGAIVERALARRSGAG